MNTSGEIGVHVLGNVTLEILGIKGRCIHNLAFYHLRSLSVIWRTIGSISRMKSQSLSLVAVASTLCSHVVQYFAILHVK